MREAEIECIKTSGGLISDHFITLMKEERCSFPFALPGTFGLAWDPEVGRLDQQEFDRRIALAWEELRKRWDDYGHRLQDMDPKDARGRWTANLLKALGYEPVATPKHIEISDRLKFRFSHRGWVEERPKPPVVHIVPPGQDLEERSQRGQPSPHDALQAYLNVHEDRWGLVTNGRYLRLLRDYHHTYSKGYVEFDLEAIFITRSFSDFRALYRMAHASRFLPTDTGDSYLEEYFKHSLAVGERVGAGLRDNVVRAIIALGNGFLDRVLLEELKGSEESCRDYYQEILKVVYRIIFLLYAEQKGMLGSRAPGHDLYLEEYSVAALRDRAMRESRRDDGHFDHWEGLVRTFEMVQRGAEELGIYPYDGMLFEKAEGSSYLSDHRCRNTELLEAIRYLTATEMDRTMRKISYSDISVEEIGSIYESLLDYTPRITESAEEIEGVSYSANCFVLDPRGSARKTTGSYYTHPDLVSELIKSALEPVLEERLEAAGPDRDGQAEAILSIKVCDPACGSGAFLIAATNRLGMELARVKAGDVPDDDAIQEAKRDVLQSCIYGVDLNPMAVELAKVSLWINAMVRDRPLNFLDHHVKCGNSLIGATPDLVAGGVPDGAFKPVTGDDKTAAKHFRALNKKQRKNLGATLDSWDEERAPGYAEEFARLSAMKETTPEEVSEKHDLYKKLLDDENLRRGKLEANAWTAAFFCPLEGENAPFPTTGEVQRLGSVGAPDDDPLARKVEELARKYRFFHWHLEFPGVSARGGFDVVLGNPPWERIKLQEKEFFAARDSEIANAPTAAARRKLIKKLKENNPALNAKYQGTLRKSEAESRFIRTAGRFPLTGVGDVNTYAVFAELAQSVINSDGKAGIIVPSGIATDYTYRNFFADLMDSGKLISLYDFENREGLFPGVHRSYKFSLLTTTGGGVLAADFAFFLHNMNDLADRERHFSLSREDLARINPNTRTCPVFRAKRDAEITRKIYLVSPVLFNEIINENPWKIKLLQGLFHSSQDSDQFSTELELLDSEGHLLPGNIFRVDDVLYYPLFEPRMLSYYDHRACSVDFSKMAYQRSGKSLETSEADHKNPNYFVMPRYWVPMNAVLNELKSLNLLNYCIAYRRITSPTNERTMMATIIPRPIINENAVVVFIKENAILMCCLVANLNTFAFDYIARQKSGVALGNSVFEQLPALAPGQYNCNLIMLIVPKVMELTYTAWDLLPFAEDILREVGAGTWNRWFPDNPLVDGKPAPFRWDEERRATLRAELDAIYAHLYGLARDDIDYILETFPIVKRKDVEKYGTYRTKEMILSYYDQYAGVVDAPAGE